MLQDVLRGVPTEIDYINGFVIGNAKKANIQSPINSLIYNLIKGQEKIRNID